MEVLPVVVVAVVVDLLVVGKDGVVLAGEVDEEAPSEEAAVQVGLEEVVDEVDPLVDLVLEDVVLEDPRKEEDMVLLVNTDLDDDDGYDGCSFVSSLCLLLLPVASWPEDNDCITRCEDRNGPSCSTDDKNKITGR